MIKAELDCTKSTPSKIEVSGSVWMLCSELGALVSEIAKHMDKNGPEAGDKFRTVFTTGFLQGLVLGTDRETMKKVMENAETIMSVDELRDLLQGINDDSDNGVTVTLEDEDDDEAQ